MKPLRIFISSVQKEFAQIRRDLKAFLLGDAVLRRFVSEVFLFEEMPAKDRRADQVYLEEVERCDIYLGIFGYDYGFEDQAGHLRQRNANTTTPPDTARPGSCMSGGRTTTSARPRCNNSFAKPAAS